MGTEPTYRDLDALLRKTSPDVVGLLPHWLKFRKTSLENALCEPLCGPDKYQWILIANRFWSYLAITAPQLTKTTYQKKIYLRTFRHLAMNLASKHRVPDAFERLEELRVLVGEKTPKAWNGRPMPESVRDFIHGRVFLFTSRSNAYLSKVEAFSGLKPGSLIAASRSAMPYAFSKNLRPADPHPAPLSEMAPLTAKIEAFIQAFIAHKTTFIPEMTRYSKWTPNFRGEYPSAKIFEWFVIRRFSFMVRAQREDGKHPDHGLGLDPAAIEPLDLFRLDIARAHLKWAVACRGGISKSFAIQFFHYGISMFNERTGFMYLQPEIYSPQLRGSDGIKTKGISTKAASRLFQNWSARQHRQYRDFIGSLDLHSSEIKYAKVRRSRARIDDILDMPQPLLALFDLVRAHKKAGEYIAFRNETMRRSHATSTFFAAVLTAAPLRLTTWCGVKLGEQLYRESGRWHLKAERALFKNRRFMKASHYEIILPEWVMPFVDHYVDVIRPHLLGARAGSPYLFTYVEPPSSGQDLKGPVSMASLRGRMLHITKSHWGAPVGPHSWRHIVATGILKEDPNAVARAAFVLNDTPETIQATYSHLTSRDAYMGFADWADRLWQNG